MYELEFRAWKKVKGIPHEYSGHFFVKKITMTGFDALLQFEDRINQALGGGFWVECTWNKLDDARILETQEDLIERLENQK